MSLSGSFHKYASPSALGIICYSFILRNTNRLFSESFDLALVDVMGQHPWFIRGQELEAGEQLVINRDTVQGWEWCQGDFCATIDSENRILDRWVLQIPVYAPGECPECHGTHKCSHCRGQGYPMTPDYHIQACPYCGATGVCQTCYIPERQYRMHPNPAVGGAYGQNPSRRNQNAVNNIMQRISELQTQLQQVEWDLKMMQLRDMDVSSHTVYTSQLQLKYNIQRQITELQSRLQDYM